MNGDLQELMEHIGNLHNKEMEAIAGLGREFSEHKGMVTAKLAAVEQTQEKHEQRQWVHSVVVAGVTTLHHTLGNLFHWKV